MTQESSQVSSKPVIFYHSGFKGNIWIDRKANKYHSWPIKYLQIGFHGLNRWHSLPLFLAVWKFKNVREIGDPSNDPVFSC